MWDGAAIDTSLTETLHLATERRAPLVERLSAEKTDTWRLFHGVAAGRPGLTVDKYGDNVLVQTFREPLADGELDTIQTSFDRPTVWRHRGARDAAVNPPRPDWALEPGTFHELGLRYDAPLLHRGADPWLFLDLRAARRWLSANCKGARVLNTFAYTGGAGLVAAAGGALETTQLDHGSWCLHAAAQLAENNDVNIEIIQADFFVAVRQFAGRPIKGRASHSGYTHFKPRCFDRIILDPPTFTRGPFGAVDIVNDYSSLAKPCIQALDDGGALLATNHSPAVNHADWVDSVQRCAAKVGRPIRQVDTIEPDGDFPSFDGQPPLKAAVFWV